MSETELQQWELVDEGWGRQGVAAATLHEPQNVREYVAVQRLLGVGAGVRMLDVACGAGLALELAAAQGATVAGIDASARLVAIARERVPDGDVRIGDMRRLPWDEGSFDVVTSFRGIWGTTPEVLDEVTRVLRPGGRLALTVWGHIKASPGRWALEPFTWAEQPKVANQAAMNSLGKPGVGEEVLTQHGYEQVERVVVPFVWEFADPETYARALAATGPAYEAIQAVGEEQFLADAAALAARHVRDGLPLRAQINVVAFVGTKPSASSTSASEPSAGTRSAVDHAEPASHSMFLTGAPVTEAAQQLYDDDLDELGFVMNASRLWAHDAGAVNGLFDLLGRVTETGGLSFRDRGILVTATAATLGDSYCSLAWGGKLAAEASPELNAAVLTGADGGLDERERALAAWARKVVSAPNSTTPSDVKALREVGYSDTQIHAITTYVALRLAFSTVNDALGARPDAELRNTVPSQILDSVTWGRPMTAR